MAIFRYTAVVVSNKGVQEVDGIIEAPNAKFVFNNFSKHGVTIRDVHPATAEDIKLWNLKKFRGALCGNTQEDTRNTPKENYEEQVIKIKNSLFWASITIMLMGFAIVFMGIFLMKR